MNELCELILSAPAFTLYEYRGTSLRHLTCLMNQMLCSGIDCDNSLSDRRVTCRRLPRHTVMGRSFIQSRRLGLTLPRRRSLWHRITILFCCVISCLLILPKCSSFCWCSFSQRILQRSRGSPLQFSGVTVVVRARRSSFLLHPWRELS